MTTLNSPVQAQNLIDRFQDFVTNTVNTSIVWAADNTPYSQFDGSQLSGSINTLVTIGVTGNNLGGSGAKINADTINRVLLGELALYTNVRYLRAILNVTGGGGNTGSYGSPGYVFDQTSKAILNNNYLQAFGSSNTLTNIAVTDTAGNFSCNSTYFFNTQQIVISGTLTGTASVTPGTYFIISTNGSTTFQLSTNPYGSAISTQPGSVDGLTFTTSYVVDKAGTAKQSTIGVTQLETFFTNLQTQYTTAQNNTVTIQVDVCHASCHSSCHSNRGRR